MMKDAQFPNSNSCAGAFSAHTNPKVWSGAVSALSIDMASTVLAVRVADANCAGNWCLGAWLVLGFFHCMATSSCTKYPSFRATVLRLWRNVFAGRC